MQVSRFSFARYLLSLALAFAVTTALVWVMQYLIRSDQMSVNETPPTFSLAFAPTVEKEPPIIDRRPKKIEPPILPPDTEIKLALLETHSGGWGEILDYREPDSDDIQIGVYDSDPLPVVRVQPNYPQRALVRGIEGYVVVEFTITASGAVANARIVEAEPRGIFNSAALKAVQRYKYKPQVIGGESFAVDGVLHRFVFELADS